LPPNSPYHNGDIAQHLGEYFICAQAHSPGAAKTPGTVAGEPYWEFQPWTATPQKASLNSATFRELYRSYWSAMCGEKPDETPFGPTAVPGDPYTIPNIQKQFRSSLRDVRKPFDPTASSGAYRFPPFQQLLLRAAIAAVNPIDLRDS